MQIDSSPKNSYIQKCSDELQHRFREVYHTLSHDKVSGEGINLLVSEVIPATGFTKGCVYLVETARMLLVPRLRIGDADLSRYKPLNCQLASAKVSPIVEALYCSTPIKQEGALLHGEKVSHVTGVIGNGEKNGVLYLEMSDNLLNSGGHEPVLLFKAIRQCLNDCLNLS